MTFYADTIKENDPNQRVLFSTFEKLLHLKTERKLPSHERALDLANGFADFFKNKVRAIRDNLTPSVAGTYHDTNRESALELHEFAPTNTTELSSVIKAMSGKSCILDPIPGVLLRDCYETLLPVIARIVNLSLDNAIVPTKFKEATLNLIIKKASLDHELYSSYRPISNLRFVSKATEKIVASRLDTHLKDGDLYQLFQSAYRAAHSTETALTRVHNDILRDIDDGQCVILILLDLSSAFDTVDHRFYSIGLNIALVSKARLLRGFALIYRTEASLCILRTNAPQAEVSHLMSLRAQYLGPCYIRCMLPRLHR